MNTVLYKHKKFGKYALVIENYSICHSNNILNLMKSGYIRFDNYQKKYIKRDFYLVEEYTTYKSFISDIKDKYPEEFI